MDELKCFLLFLFPVDTIAMLFSAELYNAAEVESVPELTGHGM